MADNVIYGGWSTELPLPGSFWSDTIPTESGSTVSKYHWRPYPKKRDELYDVTLEKSLPFGDYSPIEVNNAYLMISIPLSMINEYGTDRFKELPVRLKDVYSSMTPEPATEDKMFTYSWFYVDVKGVETDSEPTYRIYFLYDPALYQRGVYNSPAYKFTGLIDNRVSAGQWVNPDAVHLFWEFTKNV